MNPEILTFISYLTNFILTLATIAYSTSKWLEYANERAKDTQMNIGTITGLMKEQNDFWKRREDYLLDRIQTGDPVLSHNLNTESKPKPVKGVISFPAGDFEVKEVKS
jgi:hypothetical protein